MDFLAINAILEEITYKGGWKVKCYSQDDRPYIQVCVTGGVCSQTGARTDWKGAKRWLSFHMCRQEIVGAAFACIKDAEEHEMREFFRYKGRAIYNPHLNPDALVELARDKKNFVYREDSMQTGY